MKSPLPPSSFRASISRELPPHPCHSERASDEIGRAERNLQLISRPHPFEPTSKCTPMLAFAKTADRIAATTKKLQKTALLADYFKSVSVEEAAIAAVFFSGRPFTAWEETTLQAGVRLLWQIVAELSGKSEPALTDAYRE